MLWSIMPELSMCFGLILIILYGLFSLTVRIKPSTGLGFSSTNQATFINLNLADVYFFSRVWPLSGLLQYGIELGSSIGDFWLWCSFPTQSGIEVLLIVLTVVLMGSFKSFESILLLLFAFIGQLFMLHSCDLLSFYVCLEAQNFCFLILCGLQPRIVKHSSSNGSRPIAGVEASIKYLLLSAFSSGILLFWFSAYYLHTGMSTLSWSPLTMTSFGDQGSFLETIPQLFILIALIFKLGGAPLHIWMVDIYSGVKRQLLLYMSTAPKLSLFGFWISTWHSVWTDLTVFLFVSLSMLIGSLGAYSQPSLRALFGYSTINEIGLMLMAIETAGFDSLLQHLAIYVISMLLLWNLSDKRLFAVLAISMAGLPPFAGFFGKAWIFQSVAIGGIAGPYLTVLTISLFCTGLSLVFYLRVFRLFIMNTLETTTLHKTSNRLSVTNSYVHSCVDSNSNMSTKLNSFCVVFLIFAPIFLIKPFVL